MIHRIVYQSEATTALNDAELRSIAMFAALNNKAENISGLLLHHEGQIMQVLEGKAEAVQALYQRIKADKRHINVKTLVDSPCQAAIFKTWSMGYRPVNSPGKIDIFFALTRESLDHITPDTASPDIVENIKKFTDENNL